MPVHTKSDSLRQRVTGNRAGRRQGDGIDGVNAAGWADRENTVLEIRHQILPGRNGILGLVVLQRPLQFGRINLLEIGDARIAFDFHLRLRPLNSDAGLPADELAYDGLGELLNERDEVMEPALKQLCQNHGGIERAA